MAQCSRIRDVQNEYRNVCGWRDLGPKSRQSHQAASKASAALAEVTCTITAFKHRAVCEKRPMTLPYSWDPQCCTWIAISDVFVVFFLEQKILTCTRMS